MKFVFLVGGGVVEQEDEVLFCVTFEARRGEAECNKMAYRGGSFPSGVMSRELSLSVNKG